MKKTYINPEMEVVKIATQQMLASSTIVNLNNEEVNDEGDLLSRENDLDWFDED